MAEGWIKLYRQIQDSWLWQADKDDPFRRSDAWIDLLLLAHHSSSIVMFDGQPVPVKAGGIITSETKLASRWGWSRSKVHRFLTLLQNQEMIEFKTLQKRTDINVLNYGKYQGFSETGEPMTNRCRTDAEPKANTVKNDKNDNNVKKNKFSCHKQQIYNFEELEKMYE